MSIISYLYCFILSLISHILPSLSSISLPIFYLTLLTSSYRFPLSPSHFPLSSYSLPLISSISFSNSQHLDFTSLNYYFSSYVSRRPSFICSFFDLMIYWALKSWVLSYCVMVRNEDLDWLRVRRVVFL